MKYAVLILRYIKGYVSFEASGGFFERFFNLCALKKINLWNVKKDNEKLYASVSVSGFIKMREAVRKSGVRITLINKSGLAYDFRKHRKRVVLFYGILIFIAFHIILNQFVWSIDVKGNDNISKSELIYKARQQGLTYSTYIRTFDEIKASRNIAADYEGKIPWLSINIKGSLAVIELRESADSKENQIINTAPCNIVAGFDGVILSTEVFKGDLMTSVGNGVRKGDLLISGAIVNEDMSTTFYRADGKITAIHDESYKVSLNTAADIFRIAKTKSSACLNFFNLKIPYKPNGSSQLKDAYELKINNYTLPFGYIKECSIDQCEKAEDELINMLSVEKAMNDIYKKFSNSTIISKDEEIQTDGNTFFYIGDYTLIDFIGEEKPILSQKLK